MEMSQRDTQLCESIFKDIVSRQTEALMFHNRMADMYDFLGLMGFKRMHEYQYFAESAGARGTRRYFINHHNKLVMEGAVTEPKVIPAEWVKYTRFDVTPQVRKQAVERSFEEYNDWESDTKQLYEGYAKQLFEAGFIADYNKVMDLVKDVDQELKYLDRMLIKLRSVSFDAIYVASIQDELHEHYKEKQKDIGIDIC